MPRLIIFFYLLTLSVAAYASQNQEQQWMHQLEHPQFSQHQLKHNNFLSKYIHDDFSTLFTPRSDFIGYIGNDYQRLRIVLTSISKSQNNNREYLIKGISIVRNNKCIFSGVLKVQQIREYKKMHYGVDQMYKHSGFQAEGLLLASYEFHEDPAQKYSGVFKGILTLYWYVDKYGIMKYDDIESSSSDNYSNNQYVGTWTQNGKKVGKVANWGEYRVPFPGDLDTGAGEFSANPKYKSRGWEDHISTNE